MAELDFPSPPWTDQQVFGNYIYSTTVGAWTAKPLTGPKTVFGTVPPANPQLGDEWTNSNDMTTYTWYVDVDGGQWVEKRSQIAKSQVGLVPIVPTSIAVGSGTGSVDVNGNVTFTGASSLNVAGIFTSAYKNYRIVYNYTCSSASEVAAWFTNAGTSITTTWYGAAFFTQYTGATGNAQARNNGNGGWMGYASAERTHTFIDAFVESGANKPQYSVQSYLRATGNVVFGGYSCDGASDGFRVSPLTGGVTMTGTVKVYGYN